MGIFENNNYEVTELSYGQLMRIMALQAKRKAKQQKKSTAEQIMQKINHEAKAEVASWITGNE